MTQTSNSSLRGTAAGEALLVKVDNYCWDVICLLKFTVTVNWVMFIGPICTFLIFLTACVCPVKKTEHVEGEMLLVGGLRSQAMEQTGTCLRK